MPQRFLRPGIRNSDRWNTVSFAAQSLYIRLMTMVDDYGRYDGRNSVIWAECFAVWNDKNPRRAIKPQECAELCNELAAASLIDLYEADGKRFLQILQWEERVRDGTKEKYPKSPLPMRNPAESCGILPPSSPPSPSPLPIASAIAPVASAGDPLPIPDPLKTPEFVRAWQQWMTFRRGMKKPGNWLTMFQAQLKFLARYDAKTAVEILEKSITNGYQGLFEPKENRGGAGQPAANAANSTADKILWQKELERAEARMKTIRDAYSGMQTWSAGDKAEFAKLKARKAELLNLLGMVI